MFIQDNFSEMHLLFSEPVSCSLYTDQTQTVLLAKFNIVLPTVADIYFNQNVMFVLGILKKTTQELKDMLKLNTEMLSHLDFVNFIHKASQNNQGLISFMYKMQEGLTFLCPDVDFQDGHLVVKNRECTDQLFERMREIWLVSIAAKNYSGMNSYMTPEQRAMEEKIQAIKNKGKKDKSSESFEKIYIILTYEFNYTREEILKMTMYAVQRILKYTSKSINYKLTLLAKAAGNTKKIQFIADNKGE